MKGKNELIAFNDLEEKIIKPGFCTFCAACEAACPVHAIKVKDNEIHHDDCSNFLDQCSVCYDVCPHTESLIFEAMSFVKDAPNVREAIGPYIKLMLSQSVDSRLREASHSGGVVTALLTYAMDKGLIDSAIVSEVSPQSPLKLKPLICLVPDSCLSAVDSKFSPSTVVQAFGDAVHGYGKKRIAFVGLPHQILAIRKLEAWQHKIVESLTLTIGLFCLWNFSLDRLLKYLKESFQVKASDIERITLTETYNVYTRKRVVRISTKDVLSHVLDACKMCMDYTSELSDISVGDAPPLKRWSIVIIRTKKGESLFNSAVKDGVLRTMEIEEVPDVFTNLLAMASHKKKIAFEEAKRRERLNKPVIPLINRLLFHKPQKMLSLTDSSVNKIMTRKVVTVRPDITINQLLDIMTQHHHMGYPVMNSLNELIGIITFEDASRIPKEKRDEIFVGEVANKNLIVVHPRDSILEAFEKMNLHNVGRILVVNPENPKKLVGIITRTDILKALIKR